MPTSKSNSNSVLLHPIVLLAIGLLIINDHLLKSTYPGFATGKLSDLVGMIFFPILLVEVFRLLPRAAPQQSRWRQTFVASLATALVFALVNVAPWAEACYEFGLGAVQWPWHSTSALLNGGGLPALKPVSMVGDPTDLLALPAIVVPILLTRNKDRAQLSNSECPG